MPTIEKTIEVDVPVTTAYTQWTQFEEFPSFMNGVDEVRQIDNTHLHWVASIGGKTEEWDAEITEQVPDQKIAWKATSGKPNAGVVTFRPLDGNRTQIELKMDWESEGMVEELGAMLGQDGRKVKSDLEQFKTLVETRDTGMTRDTGETHDSSMTHDPSTTLESGMTADGPRMAPDTVGTPDSERST